MSDSLLSNISVKSRKFSYFSGGIRKSLVIVFYGFSQMKCFEKVKGLMQDRLKSQAVDILTLCSRRMGWMGKSPV